MRGASLLSGLSSVTCPTLVAAGDLDPMSAVDTADEIAAALPGHLVRFARFAGAGHHIHHDKPGRFFTLLRDFLGVRAATQGTRAEAPDRGGAP